ncbi:MAG TPA: hypothetical protein VKX49_12935 [Bryobacteraceae bacterium]|nr:hypothetical protein [Bryobacteraceae bacterium]
MSAAAAARIKKSPADERRLDLWRENGWTALQHKWLPFLIDITDNHTQLAIILLVLRETEGDRQWPGGKKPKGTKTGELPPAATWTPCISWAEFAKWTMRDPESIRMALNGLVNKKHPEHGILMCEQVGQSFRYRPNFAVWERLANKKRKEWEAQQKAEKKLEAEQAEDAAPDGGKDKGTIPRKFGGFGKQFIASTGFKSEEAQIPEGAKKISFEVPEGNLIILPALKNETIRISVRTAPSVVTPKEILGGKNGKSSHFNKTSDENALNVLREMLNRGPARSKLGLVDDGALEAIAMLLREEQYPDLAARIQSRIHRATSWGFVINLARDVARAAANDNRGRHVEVTDDDIAELEAMKRRQQAAMESS